MKKKKKEDGIEISPKHGLNPMLVQCSICGKETGEIALLGKLPNDEEAPMKGSLQGAICDDCKKIIDQDGVIIIEVREPKNEEEKENPYRTGRIIGVKKGVLNVKTPVAYMVQKDFEESFGEYLKNNNENE